MRTRNSVINIVVSSIVLIITTILGLILSKYFVTNIGIEKNGLNSLFTNILAILSISELGIAGAINYNLYKPVLDNDFEKISKLMTFYKKCYRVIGIIILVLSFVMSFFLMFFIKNTTLSSNYIKFAFWLFAINSASTYFFAYTRNLFYGFQQVYITSLVDFIVKSIKIFLQIYLIKKYQNYYMYLIVNIVFDFCSNLIIYIIARLKFKEVNLNFKYKDKKLEKQVFKDVRSLSVIQITNALINFTDTIIISKFVGIIQTGLYANYKLIVTQLNNFINTIFNALGASIGNLMAENKTDKIKLNLYNLQYLCFILATISFNGIMVFTQPFIKLWLGSEYLLKYSIVILIALNLYFSIQRQVVTYFLRSGGYHNKMIRVVVFESIINFALSLILVFKFGIAGVLIGTLISCLFGFIFNARILYKIYDFKFTKYIFRQTIFFIINIAIFIVNYVCSMFINFNGFGNFIMLIIIYLFTLLILILILIKTNSKLNIFYQNVKNIIKRKKV